MKRNGKRVLIAGCMGVLLFVIWTFLIQTVDVQPTGQNGTDIGFATWNHWFHSLTGVHLTLYTITDWLGLVPIAVCMGFGVLGLVQLIKRRSILKVDADIIILGLYYIAVILGYLVFEMIPINYRPIPIEGRWEASYPSSTTLLVLCVMPTLSEQVNQRVKSFLMRKLLTGFSVCFSAFMVVGRLLSGVHWLTDIVGGILFCVGLFGIYKGAVMLTVKEKNESEDYHGIS